MKRRRASFGVYEVQPGAGESRNVGLGQIATLTLAIILGVAGFAFGVFWIGALVLMGILWGSIAAEHQRQAGTKRKGVLAEVVGVVVDQAKDVAESAPTQRATVPARDSLGVSGDHIGPRLNSGRQRRQHVALT